MLVRDSSLIGDTPVCLLETAHLFMTMCLLGGSALFRKSVLIKKTVHSLEIVRFL